MFFIYPRLHNLDASPLGRGKKNGIVWEKFPRRLRRLYGKIAEVIWEDCGGYIGRLWRLYGKITEVIWEDCGGYMGRLRRLYGKTPWDPVGLPLEPLGP